MRNKRTSQKSPKQKRPYSKPFYHIVIVALGILAAATIAPNNTSSFLIEQDNTHYSKDIQDPFEWTKTDDHQLRDWLFEQASYTRSILDSLP